jgi:hydrogenase maturation protein HypF
MEVAGVVQGVGFRPFVYRLARRFGVGGWVLNHAQGVTIEAEGAAVAMDNFLRTLKTETPLLARISAVREEIIPALGEQDFEIRGSRGGEERKTFISPDTHVCDDCVREMFDPADRRYRYPFINCTNCGPRYSIISDIPYDRPNTTMSSFEMCPECRREYEDSNDRRFHAQPIACPACGPQVELWDASGQPLSTAGPILETVAMLRRGEIVAVKGIGGFHLVCDATNAQAVAALRERKRREEKPFAVMAKDIASIRRFAEADADEEQALRSFRRPIVLLRKRVPEGLAAGVAPRNRCYGVMLPYTPIHHLLFAEGFAALVMTSANLSDEPICIGNREAVERLRGIADAYLVHNRDIHARSDDSIVRVMGGLPRVLRRSRGYVPLPVPLEREGRQVLAVGAELKGSICLAKGGSAFLSQYLGDLDNDLALAFLEEVAGHLKRVLEIEPEVVARDMHPDYLSTRYAEGLGLPTISAQHHHAHAAALMAEHRQAGPVLGVVLDGTGYGPDGTIWGGEFLIADLKGYRRVGRLSPMPLPGGDAAVREPWRTAVGYLYSTFGDEWRDLDIPFVRRMPMDKCGVIAQMVRDGINCPMTSSTGRLFDAISSILGVRDRNSYEGQAPMELEAAASEKEAGALPVRIDETDGMLQMDVRSVIREVVAHIRDDHSPEAISARFHAGLSKGIVEMCRRIQERERFSHVGLSGGVFQNKLLFEGTLRMLRAEGFAILTHELVPPSDGCIPLGQAAIAGASGPGLDGDT